MARLLAPLLLILLGAVTATALNPPDSQIEVVMTPGAVARGDRVDATARRALDRFEAWLGPLPLRTLTIEVDRWDSPRAGAAAPGHVVGLTRWLTRANERAADRLLIGAIAREYWPELLEQSPSPHASFVDGLREYVAARAIHETLLGTHDYSERFFGGFVPYVVRALPLSLRPDDPRPQVRWFAELEPGGAIATGETARRVADAMFTLERYIGWPEVQVALASFANERRTSESAGPAEFVRILNEVSGRDLSGFFAEVFKDGATFDYAVSDFGSERSNGGPQAYETTVTVTRHGSAIFPDTELAVSFEDGSEVRERWDGRDQRRTFTFASRSPAVTARVDPDTVLLLDADRANNSRSLSARPLSTVLRWTAQWLVWLENTMLTYGAFL